MQTGTGQDLLHEVVEAHGGKEYWKGLAGIEVDLSAKGFLFTAKRRPELRHVHMRADCREPRFTFFDFPKPGQRSEFLGDAEVRIVGPGEEIIARRDQPRRAFRGLRRLFSWDDLDFIYFAGYATWNYLTSPFLLLREGFILERLSPIEDGSEALTRLTVHFPAEVPTHSPKQMFYFDAQHLLRRLDYTAEVVGGWARAAHFCDGYKTFGSLKVPTRRRVLPLGLGGNLLPGPTLVALDVHDVRPIPVAASHGSVSTDFTFPHTTES